MNRQIDLFTGKTASQNIIDRLNEKIQAGNIREAERSISIKAELSKLNDQFKGSF